jgi:SAM-dependent methyltransferase
VRRVRRCAFEHADERERRSGEECAAEGDRVVAGVAAVVLQSAPQARAEEDEQERDQGCEGRRVSSRERRPSGANVTIDGPVVEVALLVRSASSGLPSVLYLGLAANCLSGLKAFIVEPCVGSADEFSDRLRTTVSVMRVTSQEVAALDPYQLMAVLGKRVIHPGGTRSTEELFGLARIQCSDHVLEVGCGVGTTAIEIARRFGARVTAIDIDEEMLEAAKVNVHRAGFEGEIELHRADIQRLPFPDETFDRVVIEAVTMFVDRDQAAREVVRVCKIGGRVVDHEFIWRKSPPVEARRVFMGEVCPGIDFDSPEDWRSVYEQAGLKDINFVTGPFAMMTPAGFVRDEGRNTARVFLTAISRLAYLRKLAWLMRRMARSMPYLGYVVIGGVRLK